MPERQSEAPGLLTKAALHCCGRPEAQHADELQCTHAADVQKYSKQAIFAAHRNDTARCGKLLLDAAVIAGEILPILKELPNLRYGSFSNAMEEVRSCLSTPFMPLRASHHACHAA